MSSKGLGRAGPLVLVVEADPLVRMAAISIVERAGCSALRAADAEDALHVLEMQRSIRLVIADADAEGRFDGLSLAHAIRRRWPPVSLLLVSARRVLTEAELPARSRFLAKPFEEAAIASAISELLASGARDDEYGAGSDFSPPAVPDARVFWPKAE